MVNALCVLRKSTFPELLVLLENVSKMKLLSDLLNDFFFQYCSFHRTMFSAKYYANTWRLLADTAGRRLLGVQLIFSVPRMMILFVCLRNLFFIQKKQGKHNIGIRKLSSLRAYCCNSCPSILCPGVVCLLLCLGFMSHAKSMDRE